MKKKNLKEIIQKSSDEKSKSDLLKEQESLLLERDAYDNMKPDLEPVEMDFDSTDDSFSSPDFNIQDDMPESGIFKDKIGNLLVKSGVITQEQLDTALAIQVKKAGL